MQIRRKIVEVFIGGSNVFIKQQMNTEVSEIIVIIHIK
jgi:site-specific DNA-adenine methylase